MILAIDTSTRWLGLAICTQNAVISEKIWQTQRRHTIELAPAVAALINESGLAVDSFEAVAVALGPGSFTSLRIGLAFAKGFALTRHLPILGVPSLDILARMQPPNQQKLICVLQAGRKNLAAAHYELTDGVWKCCMEPYITNAVEIEKMITAPTVVAGELSREDRGIIARKWKNAIIASPTLSIRRPAFLAEIAFEKIQNNDFIDPNILAPIYLQSKS